MPENTAHSVSETTDDRADRPFEIDEFESEGVLAGKCSSATCCLASGSPEEEPFVIDELDEPEALAGKCSSATCCLAYGGIDEDWANLS
jgi:hypothetical protein